MRRGSISSSKKIRKTVECPCRRLISIDRSQNLQVEFKSRRPTYRVLPGTAKKSHAELVAEKIGFSPKDIDVYLERRGIK